MKFKFLAVIAAVALSFGAASADQYLTLNPFGNAKTGGFIGANIGFGLPTGIPGSHSASFKLEAGGGYQWYFYNKPYFHLGVRGRAYLEYENFRKTDAIAFGMDVAILWDFLDMGSQMRRHTLGVHFSPIGFKAGKSYARATGSSYYGATIAAYALNLGLHYYFNLHHQVSVDYKHFAGDTTGYDDAITFGYAYKF